MAGDDDDNVIRPSFHDRFAGADPPPAAPPPADSRGQAPKVEKPREREKRRRPRKLPAAPWLNGGGNIKWKALLMLNDDDKPLRTVVNALVAFAEAPEFSGLFAKDIFSSRVILSRELPGGDSVRTFPREITDADVTNATAWLNRNGIMLTSGTVLEAIAAVAERNPIHPVREYLSTLIWDEEPRIDLWLHHHLGVKDDDLTRAFAAKWLIGMVARIYEPGCQFDTMLVLEGPQGLGKSSALQVLTEPWYTDHLSDLSKKDAVEEIQGVWCVEVAELASFSNTDTRRIKSFISGRSDRFRPSYARVAADHKRQCGFAGTMNNAINGYLRDETGARRFWPVLCGEAWEAKGEYGRHLDRDVLEGLRDQLWAEAVKRYQDNESWHLHTSMLEHLQRKAAAERSEEDPWLGDVVRLIAGRSSITIPELIGSEGLALPKNQQDRAAAIRIGRILTQLGYTKKRESGGDRVRRYYPPPHPDTPDPPPVPEEDSAAEPPAGPREQA